MTRTLIVLCTLAGLTAWPPQAYAEEVATSGYGVNACAKINAVVSPGTGWGNDYITMGMMSWMQGFISGVNDTAFAFKDRVRKDYYNLGTISDDEKWGYVIDFCRRNPDKYFFQAVVDLMAKRLEVLPAPPAHQ